jgi:hypothetical protein
MPPTEDIPLSRKMKNLARLWVNGLRRNATP